MRQEYITRLSQITPEEQHILQGGSIDMGRYNRSGAAVMDPAILMPDGQLFGIRPHTRFTAFPPHTHNYVEMVYQVGGHSTHHMASGATVALRAGHLLLLGRGSTHSIDRCGREDLAVNFILIPRFFDNAAISMAKDNALSAFLTGNLQKSQTITVICSLMSAAPQRRKICWKIWSLWRWTMEVHGFSS